MNWFRKRSDRTEHGYVEERLSAYLDGALSSQERMAVDRHLATCQTCRWNLDTLRQTVQWTRELPTVPVPRVFTVPVPAQPARAARRRWNFVPLLQGATALVALLLAFVVAGDVMLTGVMPVSAPQPAAMHEPPAATVEMSQEIVVKVIKEVEKKEEAPRPEAEIVGEKAIAEPTQAPLAQEVPAAESAPIEPAATEGMMAAPPAQAFTPTTEDRGLGEEARGTPTWEGEEAMPTTRALESAGVPTLVVTVTRSYTLDAADEVPTVLAEVERMLPPTATVVTVIVAEPTPVAVTPAPAAFPTPLPQGSPAAKVLTEVAVEPTPLPAAPTAAAPPTEAVVAPTPTASPVAVAPTVVAESRQAAPSFAADRAERSGMFRESVVPWLHLGEFVLGVAFVLLATTTIIVMIRRHRAR